MAGVSENVIGLKKHDWAKHFVLLVDNPSPRGSTLEQLEVAIQNVGVWTKMSEQLLGKMAMLDGDK
jgi:hypothetical protein